MSASSRPTAWSGTRSRRKIRKPPKLTTPSRYGPLTVSPFPSCMVVKARGPTMGCFTMLCSWCDSAGQARCRARPRRVVLCLRPWKTDSVGSRLTVLFVRTGSERPVVCEVSAIAGYTLRGIPPQTGTSRLRLVELRYYYFCRRNRHSSARGAQSPFDNGKSVQNFSSSKDCIHFADCTASNAVMRSGSHPLADHSVQPMSSATGGAEARRFAVSFFFSTR